jgi:UrcA family protein
MSMNTMFKTAIALLSFNATIAVAQSSVRVKFSELDTAKPAGIEMLYQRIRAAADTVCIERGVRDLQSGIAGRKCKAQAIERAVSDVNLPRLTAMHRARAGAADTIASIVASK